MIGVGRDRKKRGHNEETETPGDANALIAAISAVSSELGVDFDAKSFKRALDGSSVAGAEDGPREAAHAAPERTP